MHSILSKWYVKLALLGCGNNEIAIILSGTTAASLLSLSKINMRMLIAAGDFIVNLHNLYNR